MTFGFEHSMAWVALILGIGTFVVGLSRRAKFKSQFNWTLVPGVIVTSEVKWESGLYIPTVTYRYEDAGRKFTGNTVVSGLISFSSRAEADRVCAKYPVNAEVPVYIAPSQPSHAVLEVGGDRAYFPFMCCLGFISISFGILLLAH
ncbi:DUF3592 domain-containing protein [Rhodoferax saidenbachensis]|uniref:DUF3592 domain-containing protein n=1 Tax=Rhodoferax saidenbachensis TaxID=1484693 RepID=A0A1P8K740_9BURK|nr:DUF3592 domain-containing protein [Rhodoferax saidenbachensis]APW41832.1 hypothetical protein RS694_04250 [Rhodoferax saidenbachensis]